MSAHLVLVKVAVLLARYPVPRSLALWRNIMEIEVTQRIQSMHTLSRHCGACGGNNPTTEVFQNLLEATMTYLETQNWAISFTTGNLIRK